MSTSFDSSTAGADRPDSGFRSVSAAQAVTGASAGSGATPVSVGLAFCGPVECGRVFRCAPPRARSAPGASEKARHRRAFSSQLMQTMHGVLPHIMVIGIPQAIMRFMVSQHISSISMLIIPVGIIMQSMPFAVMVQVIFGIMAMPQQLIIGMPAHITPTGVPHAIMSVSIAHMLFIMSMPIASALCRAGHRRRSRQAHLRSRAPGMAGCRSMRVLAPSRASRRLLETNPPLARARSATDFPYIDPLNHVQIELLRRHRAGDTAPEVVQGIHLSINGIAAGLRNSG